MKKLGVVLLAVALAFGVMGGGVSYLSAEDSAEKVPGDFTSAANLFVETDDLLDSYAVDAESVSNRPYPADWGMKFGKTNEGEYTCMNNERQERANQAHTAVYLPMSRSVAGTAAYYVSADITVGSRADWGGLGIVIGEGTDDAKSPVGIWYCVDDPKLVLASGGNEFAAFFGTEQEDGSVDPGVAFAVGDTFTLSAVVDGQKISVYVDGNKIGAAYTLGEDSGFIPKIGAELKNYNGRYTNFVFKTLEAEPEVTLAEFEQADNLFVDSAGLADTYEFDKNMNVVGAYPSDYGMKFGKTSGGYYTRVNNKMQDFCTSGAHTASYLATSKDIGNVKTYCVSAEITIGDRADWGGLGIVIGKGTTEREFPVGVWYCVDAPGLFLAADGNEFANAFGLGQSNALVVGDTFTLAAVVDGQKVSVYIDGEKIGDTYTIATEFTPAIGAEVKQYYSKYRDFTFKTLDTGLQAAEYTVTCISGAVEIGTIGYTYGEGVALAPIERKGYQFMGWHLFPDLSDPVIESIDAAIGGNITVYCEYKIANYSIAYYDGETKIENDKLVKSYTMQQYVQLPGAEDMEKEGYTFEGWYTAADFSGNAVTAIEMGSTGDKVFYAKYTKVGGTSSGGCGGSVIGVSSVFALAALGAAAVMFKRKKAGGR